MTPALGAVAILGACGSAGLRLPPVDARFDYQLGGAYPPPDGAAVVVRDRRATPAPGVYNICYVNGFQIQPEDAAAWRSQHPDLILRDRHGQPLRDEAWNETLIDVRATRRGAVAEIVGAWIAGCKAAGFDAVEIDNLDSYTRSGGLVQDTDAVATMALFSGAAHAAGLAIAQKNAAALVARRAQLGTDFAIAEECSRYAECDAYRDAYAGHVLVIEYRREDFRAACAAYPGLSIVLRDRPLSRPGDPGYVFDSC